MDGGTLIDPPPGVARLWFDANAQRRLTADCDLQGRSLADLSSEVQSQLVRAAAAYTAEYRDVSLPVVDDAAPARTFGEHAAAATPRLMLAGHQPQLFHPGVWFKNFVLSRLARQIGAVPVNLVIDSDTCKTVSLRVPGGSVAQPVVESIAFDEASDEIPFEERRIVDQPTFESFGERRGGTSTLCCQIRCWPSSGRESSRGAMSNATWACVSRRLGTNKKRTSAHKRSNCRRASSARCRLSTGSPAICWLICRGSGKSITPLWANIAA